MSVKLNNLTPQIRMNVNNSTKVRQTVDTSFGAKLRDGLSATAKVVGGAANMASAVVPGGTILSAALSGAGKASSTAAALTANSATGGGAAGAAAQGAAGGSGIVGQAFGGNSGVTNAVNSGGNPNNQFASAKKMFEMQSAFNLQFLQLQGKMQHESRSFQALSNVMKNRQQSAMSAVRNIN